MMDLLLPGRDSDPEDYEAQSALRTLLESEKIQHCEDDDLLGRIAEQIKYNQDMLARVSGIIEGLKSDDGDEEGAVPLFADTGEERTDTRTIDDFLTRINRVRKVEHAKNLMPLKGGKRYG
jgi:hypothetical protein